MKMAALSSGCLISDLPENFNEAIKDANRKIATQYELTSLQESQTWVMVEPPEDEEIIHQK